MGARDLIPWLTETARDGCRAAVVTITDYLTPCSARESDLEARNLRLRMYVRTLEARVRTLEAALVDARLSPVQQRGPTEGAPPSP